MPKKREEPACGTCEEICKPLNKGNEKGYDECKAIFDAFNRHEIDEETLSDRLVMKYGRAWADLVWDKLDGE